MEDRGLDDRLGRNVQPLELVVQRGQVYAEKLSGPCLMAAGSLQRRLDQMGFEGAEFVRQANAAAQIYSAKRSVGFELLHQLKRNVFQKLELKVQQPGVGRV